MRNELGGLFAPQGSIADSDLVYPTVENVFDNHPALIEAVQGYPYVLYIVNQVAAHDAPTAKHMVNAAKVAAVVAPKIGLGSQYIERMAIRATLIHDGGKKYTPLYILNKPGKLDDEEQATAREHVEYGYMIALPYEQHVAAVVHGHHLYQPNGYPEYLLKEPELPLLGTMRKVVALADTTDAMIADRPGSPSLAPDIAFKQLTETFGKYFDEPVIKLALLTRLDLAA